MASISSTQSNLQAALASFLGAVLPNGTPIVSGQQNRVAEPFPGDFVVFTPIRFTRLATNLDGDADVKFEATVNGLVMTVAQVFYGTISVGAVLFGVGVPSGTIITGQISGVPGGVGTYAVNKPFFVPVYLTNEDGTPLTTEGDEILVSEQGTATLAAGQLILVQSAEAVVQIDFHSADTTAGDMAQIISTTLRDEFGVDYFAGLAVPLNGVVPLYTDDPKQMPFINDQNQYEWRWVLEAHFQVNQAISVPQAYAESADLDVISARVLANVLLASEAGAILTTDGGVPLTPG